MTVLKYRAGGVAQLTEWLPNRHEGLGLILSTGHDVEYL